MSAASSPLTPRLTTVKATAGKRLRSSTSRRAGYDAAGVLAPAPAVDDEPRAIMVTGRPAAMRRRIRANGAKSRPKWALSLHTYAASAARADNGTQSTVAARPAKANRAKKRIGRLTAQSVPL